MNALVAEDLRSKTERVSDEKYFNLISFVATNAVAGEIMAVDNYSQMVPLLDDVAEKIEAVDQAHEEAKHIMMLEKLGARLNIIVHRRIIEPQWLKVRGYFSEAANKKDLASCLIIQDLMTETFAVVLYRTLAREGDEATASIAKAILADEEKHLGIGIERLKRMIAADHQDVHDSLVWSHQRVMPELFSMISTDCHYLCGELGVECGTFGPESLNTDIETLKVDALDTYMDTLSRVGFDDHVVTPLIASMSSYGVQPFASSNLRVDNCAPGGSCC